MSERVYAFSERSAWLEMFADTNHIERDRFVRLRTAHRACYGLGQGHTLYVVGPISNSADAGEIRFAATARAINLVYVDALDVRPELAPKPTGFQAISEEVWLAALGVFEGRSRP